MAFGMTPGEQYLAFIDLPEDDYPATGQLARDLDEAIMAAAEQVVTDWREEDALLRALLHEECGLHTWATYPAGQLPAGNEIKIINYYGLWCGRITGPETTKRYGRHLLRIDWTTRADNRMVAEPNVEPTTEVDAWVPIPFDLSALIGEPRAEIADPR